MKSVFLKRQVMKAWCCCRAIGAGGMTLSGVLAARAAPDGNTLLLSWAGTLVSAVTMYKSKH